MADTRKLRIVGSYDENPQYSVDKLTQEINKELGKVKVLSATGINIIQQVLLSAGGSGFFSLGGIMANVTVVDGGGDTLEIEATTGAATVIERVMNVLGIVSHSVAANNTATINIPAGSKYCYLWVTDVAGDVYETYTAIDNHSVVSKDGTYLVHRVNATGTSSNIRIQPCNPNTTYVRLKDVTSAFVLNGLFFG